MSDLLSFHVSRAVLELQDRRTEDHTYVAQILDYYLDIRETQDDFILRLRNFVQSNFAGQASILAEVMDQLNIVSLNVEEDSPSTFSTVLIYVDSLASLPGVDVLQVGAVISVLNLGLQIVSDLKSDEAKQVDLSNASWIGRATDIQSKIRGEFFALGRALDEAGKVMSSNISALEQWRDVNPKFVTDTATLERLANGAFRSFCWSHLLPVGCQLAEEVVLDKGKDINLDSVDGNQANEWLQNYVKDCRNADPSILAARYYTDRVYWDTRKLYKRWVPVHYRIKTRTSGNLLDKTVHELMVSQGFTPQRLFEGVRIPVNEADLHPILANVVFTRSNLSFCDHTTFEAKAIIASIK